MEDDNERKNEKLFTSRANGMGWDLNFNNKWSYVILAIILIIPFATAAWALLAK